MVLHPSALSIPTPLSFPFPIPIPDPEPTRIYADRKQTVFVGHDASRALALTSTKSEDVKPEWYDLEDDKKKVLEDWYTFFSKRYNIVGKVEGATNL